MKLRHQLALSAFAVFALIFSGSGLTLIEISARLRQQDQIDALIAQNRAIDGMLSSAAALWRLRRPPFLRSGSCKTSWKKFWRTVRWKPACGF